MATQLFTNNASTTLNGGITDTATSIVVTDGSVFPSPGVDEYFLLTLNDGTNIEIVNVTDNTANTLTVTRAQEGTTGFAFLSGDEAEMRVTAGALDNFLQTGEAVGGANNFAAATESFVVALGDESTAATVGVAKATFRIPYGFQITDVYASLTVAGTTSGVTEIDINENGVSILSTKLTIDFGELTSTTAATPAVISDAVLAADSEITFDVDVITGGATEAGLKVVIEGYNTEAVGGAFTEKTTIDPADKLIIQDSEAADANKVVTAATLLQIEENAQVGTTYTLVADDAFKLVSMTNAAASTLTVPPNASVAFPIGTQLIVSQLGAGQVTLTEGAGVTINSPDAALAVRVQFSSVTLFKTATDTWLAAGDLA